MTRDHEPPSSRESGARPEDATHLELAEDLGEAAIAEDDGAGHAGADEDDHTGEAHARLHQRHGCERGACAKGATAEETLARCVGGRGGGRMRAERG
jgi:hypothetical protein